MQILQIGVMGDPQMTLGGHLRHSGTLLPATLYDISKVVRKKSSTFDFNVLQTQKFCNTIIADCAYFTPYTCTMQSVRCKSTPMLT